MAVLKIIRVIIVGAARSSLRLIELVSLSSTLRGVILFGDGSLNYVISYSILLFSVKLLTTFGLHVACDVTFAQLTLYFLLLRGRK